MRFMRHSMPSERVLIKPNFMKPWRPSKNNIYLAAPNRRRQLK